MWGILERVWAPRATERSYSSFAHPRQVLVRGRGGPADVTPKKHLTMHGRKSAIPQLARTDLFRETIEKHCSIT